MHLMTQTERQNLVDELRDMAGAASTAEVREALFRMADRYACERLPSGMRHWGIRSSPQIATVPGCSETLD
jgi:hypothetical protein